MADSAQAEFDKRLQALVSRMAEIGHPVRVTSGKRTAEEQARLFAKGRGGDKRESIVTEKSGQPGDESRHQLGEAADLYFTGQKQPWDVLGKEAKALGLEWGGDWKTLVDRPHVQMPKPTVQPARLQSPAGANIETHAPSRFASPAMADRYTGFDAWYAGMAWQHDLNPNPDDPAQFYDYRAAHDAGAQPDASGHWPSTFKKPGHPNMVVGGYDVQTGEPAPGVDQITDPDELMRLGWDRAAAVELPKRVESTVAPVRHGRQTDIHLPAEWVDDTPPVRSGRQTDIHLPADIPPVRHGRQTDIHLSADKPPPEDVWVDVDDEWLDVAPRK